MVEVTSRHMECTLLTSNYSQMPAVALQFVRPTANYKIIINVESVMKRNLKHG